MFQKKNISYGVLIAFAIIVVVFIIRFYADTNLKAYSRRLTEQPKHTKSNKQSIFEPNNLEKKSFGRQQEMLLFSNKTINTKKNNECSEFTVYLFENLNTDTPEKSFISTFKMPFLKNTNPIIVNPDTELYWYTLLEIIENKWMFVNMTSLGTFTFFDISYSPEQRKLEINGLDKMKNRFIDGFIKDFNPVDNYFVDDEGNFYDKYGNSLVLDKKFNGIYCKLSDVCKQNGKIDPVGAAQYLDDKNIVFFINSVETLLVKITKIDKNNTNLMVNPAEQYKKSITQDNLPAYTAQTAKGGKGYLVRSHTGTYAPLAASSDKNKIAFLSRYPDCSKFPPGKTPSYITDYENQDFYLWLCIWDMEKNVVRKIVTLPKSYILPMPFTLLWAPEPNSRFISYNCYDGLFVIDITKKTVKLISKEDSSAKVIRWSPDGSMLGFLDGMGDLHIYNVTKDTTTKINSDKDCFNFVWVK